MKEVEYGLAVYDRISGTIYEVMHMGLGGEPIDVQSIPHPLEEAAKRGWELCGTMPGSVKGNSMPDLRYSNSGQLSQGRGLQRIDADDFQKGVLTAHCA